MLDANFAGTLPLLVLCSDWNPTPVHVYGLDMAAGPSEGRQRPSVRHRPDSGIAPTDRYVVLGNTEALMFSNSSAPQVKSHIEPSSKSPRRGLGRSESNDGFLFHEGRGRRRPLSSVYYHFVVPNPSHAMPTSNRTCDSYSSFVILQGCPTLGISGAHEPPLEQSLACGTC